MSAEHQESNQEKPPREGILFNSDQITDNLDLSNPLIRLFVDHQDRPIHSIHSKLLAEFRSGVNTDEIFQHFVRAGVFMSVDNPEYRSILTAYADEKEKGLKGEHLTYRFLIARPIEAAEMPGNPNQVYILTTDKSDLVEWQEYNRNLKRRNSSHKGSLYMTLGKLRSIGTPLPEELGSKPDNVRVSFTKGEELAGASPIVRRVFETAVTQQTVDQEDVRTLERMRLIRMSTAFRSSYYLGEQSLLRYNFTDENGVKNIGYLGFDGNGELITIDRRSPGDKPFYRDSKEGWIIKD